MPPQSTQNPDTLEQSEGQEGDRTPNTQLRSLTRTITTVCTQTREEAMTSAGPLVDAMSNSRISQESLVPTVKAWLTKERFRVLPERFKERVYVFAMNYLPEFGENITPNEFEDCSTWYYEVQTEEPIAPTGSQDLADMWSDLDNLTRPDKAMHEATRKIKVNIMRLFTQVENRLKFAEARNEAYKEALRGVGPYKEVIKEIGQISAVIKGASAVMDEASTNIKEATQEMHRAGEAVRGARDIAKKRAWPNSSSTDEAESRIPKLDANRQTVHQTKRPQIRRQLPSSDSDS